MVEMKWEEFKRRFPHLAEELDRGDAKLQIDSVRTISEKADRTASNLSGYVPTVIDYLRRCDDEKEALATINYLESKGEITTQYATRLRTQLRTQGVRGFGPRKDDDHYQQKTANV